ncbi:hypothetical protein QMO46_14835 [Microbacterium barkeri]|nr:hypothetical protein [Microbacterium barkeri]MDI6944768.1 hypothetical protein [Microbacterium barkeri]
MSPRRRRLGSRSRAEPERDGDRLVVVEEERRHRRAGGEAVPARDARARVDRIAERAQAADVGAHGPRAHAEALRERRARPVASRLKE